MGTRLLQHEIEVLKRRLLELCASVEKQVSDATDAVDKGDAALAQRVIAQDEAIDTMEVDIEEENLKVLALYQPVAIDLRVVVSMLKINNDLERIGDLAVNIAGSAIHLADMATPAEVLDLPPMVDRVRTMLRESVDAMVAMDAEAARRVVQADSEVDAMHYALRDVAVRMLREGQIDPLAILLLRSVAHSLERIGDHAANIAEDIVYMCEGEIIRHSQNDAAGGA